MEKEIYIQYDEDFIKDLEKYEFKDKIFVEIEKKVNYLKFFPKIGQEISGGFRKNVFFINKISYVFSYKYFEEERKIIIYRLKNCKENNFET